MNNDRNVVMPHTFKRTNEGNEMHSEYVQSAMHCTNGDGS